MKIRLLVMTCLAAATTASLAQSKVELYGIVDAGVTRVSGLKVGSVTQLASGVMEGSRIGVRGQEDLGDGYRAIFTLENRLEVDTGGISNRPPSRNQLPDRATYARYLLPSLSPGQQTLLQPVLDRVSNALGTQIGINVRGDGPAFFDRQAYVGLVTPVGALLAGRMYTPAFELLGTFDALNTQSSLALGQIAVVPYAVEIRVSNALAYRVQKDAITASVQVAFGEKSAEVGRSLGALAMYRTDAFGVGVGYNTRNNEHGQSSLTSAVIGAYLTVGAGRIHASASSIRDRHPSGVPGIATQITPLVVTLGGSPALAGQIENAYTEALKQDAGLFHLGYRHQVGAATFYVAYNAYDDHRAANADVASYGVACTYALSKRTDVSAVVTHFNNTGLGQAAPGGGGYLGGVTARAGADSTSVALGVRHRF